MLNAQKFKKIALISEVLSLEETEFNELDYKYLSEFRRDFKFELEFLKPEPTLIEKNDVSYFQPAISRECLKKIHRALVKITHPDLNPEHGNNDEFMKIQQAYEQGNVSVMVEAAAHNNIGIDFAEGDLLEMEKQLQNRRKVLEQKKRSVRWIWCRSNKSNVLRNQIRQSMGINLTNYKTWMKSNHKKL